MVYCNIHKLQATLSSSFCSLITKMMLPVTIIKGKFLLPCIFIVLILLQFAASEKEPHEDSKEDGSVRAY